MEKEPRKATDVLLDLESKIEILLAIVKSQDLNIKLLSNKLNSVMEKLEQYTSTPSKITVEAVESKDDRFFQEDENKQIPVSSDFNLSVDTNPQGFRRTSRPETYSGDNMYLARQEPIMPSAPIQIPSIPTGSPEVKVSDEQPIINQSQNKKTNKKEPSKGSVPVIQRIVDKNGKSVFLADVEVMDSSGASIFKTRTNGTGKWMASLPIGNYKVLIRKRESVTKEKMESVQSIEVDGLQSPLELQTMIIR